MDKAVKEKISSSRKKIIIGELGAPPTLEKPTKINEKVRTTFGKFFL